MMRANEKSHEEEVAREMAELKQMVEAMPYPPEAEIRHAAASVPGFPLGPGYNQNVCAAMYNSAFTEAECKKAGAFLYAAGGIEAMRTNFYAIINYSPLTGRTGAHNLPGSDYERTVAVCNAKFLMNHFWNGIGTWQA